MTGFHYNDVIVGAMASQITSLTIVDSTVYSKKTSKLLVSVLCGGNSPVTGEFPPQRASNGEMFPFDDVIMYKTWFSGEIMAYYNEHKLENTDD